jgi:hypothetical protein
MLPAGIVGDLRQQLLQRMRDAFAQAQGKQRKPIDAVLGDDVVKASFGGSEMNAY